MADLAVNTIFKTRPRSGRDAFPIANTAVVYAGALVQLSAGFLDDWDDAGAGSTFQGILLSGDQTGNAPGETGFTGDTSGDPAPDPEGRVDTSGVVLMHLASVQSQAALAQANVGDLVYCPDSDVANLTTISSGSTDPIGFIVRFRTATDSDVQLFTPAEFLAQQTA